MGPPITSHRSPVALHPAKREWPLLVTVLTTALFLTFGGAWLADLSRAVWLAFIFTWLFAVILLSAFASVRHAESLAAKLGEPLGTLILTLAITGLEVMMISAVMYTGKGSSIFARDALFGAVMIVLNGMVGLSLVLGGLRHPHFDRGRLVRVGAGLVGGLALWTAWSLAAPDNATLGSRPDPFKASAAPHAMRPSGCSSPTVHSSSAGPAAPGFGPTLCTDTTYPSSLSASDGSETV